MTLSAVLTAAVEFVSAEWQEAGRPAPDRALRYFGTDGMPQDCCTENGVLSITWERGFSSDSFPAESSNAKHPCPGLPVYVLAVRFDTCWAKPEVGPQGVIISDDIDTAWDTKAAQLSDAADHVYRAFLRLACGDAEGDHVDALLATVRSKSISPREVVAKINADCARITWRINAGPRAGA